MKKHDPKLKDFELLPDSYGIILNGIYIKKDRSEVIVRGAWGGSWNFKFQELEK